jgi:hypothetical protein
MWKWWAQTKNMKQEKKVQENEEIVIKPKCVLEHKREMG